MVDALRKGHGAEAIMAQGVPHDPFTGAPMGFVAAARLLGQWRRMIEDNRRIVAIFGIAGWKKATLDALLWNGMDVAYRRDGGG
jgi:capsular polysaccharide export protein